MNFRIASFPQVGKNLHSEAGQIRSRRNLSFYAYSQRLES